MGNMLVLLWPMVVVVVMVIIISVCSGCYNKKTQTEEL